MKHWISILFTYTVVGDCWIPDGNSSKRPYVRGYMGGTSHGTTAGHFICSVLYGPCPDDHEAAHSCHNGACIAPHHLSWKPIGVNAVEHLPFKTGRVESARAASLLGIAKTLALAGKVPEDRGIRTTPTGLICRVRVRGKSYTRTGTREELRKWRDDTLSQLGANK